MSVKGIGFLNGKVENGRAVLSWYKTTPLFEKKEIEEFSEFFIYRKCADDFSFGLDYEEFFCGLTPEHNDLIYHGPLECSNDRRYVFEDCNTETGRVYAYFVKSKTLPLVGPLPLKIRDGRVWWSYETFRLRLLKLRGDYPDMVKLETCGRTVEGREIFSLKIGFGSPALGLAGAMHSGEAGPELIVNALELLLREKPKALKKRSIAAIPSINIDSRERLAKGNPWYLRKNIAGVDLNRNFPADWDEVGKGYGLSTDDPESMTYRGAYPASEPEVRAVMGFFKANKPKVIFSFHALAGICGLHAVANSGVDKTDSEFYEQTRRFVNLYGIGLYPELKPDNNLLGFWGAGGSFVRWAWQELRVPTFDMELSSSIAADAFQKCHIDKTDPELLEEYSLRHCRAIKNIMEEI